MASWQGAVDWAQERADNPFVGYSKDFRCGQTLTRANAGGSFTYASNYLNDFTGDRYDATLTYYDCSSLTYYALDAGGWDIVSVVGTYPWTTSVEVAYLKQLGFYEVTGKALKMGDIAWKSGHTAIVKSDCDKNNVNIIEAYGRNSNGYVPFLEQVRETWRDDFTNFYRSDAGGDPSPYTPTEINIYLVAAIAGNFRQESGINPGVWESLVQVSWTSLYSNGTGGYGLGQWTNTNGDTHGRLYQLYQWLTGKGFAPDSGDGQVQYIIVENVWVTAAGSTGAQYNYGYYSLSDFLQTTETDLEILTHAWNACWEGIKDSSWDTRVEYAHDMYDYIVAHKDDESITSWITGNRYLSLDEMHNNAVMLYRALYNEFNELGYTTSAGGENGTGVYGDIGRPNTNNDTALTFNDFLTAMLAKDSNNGMYLPLHIIKRR